MRPPEQWELVLSISGVLHTILAIGRPEQDALPGKADIEFSFESHRDSCALVQAETSLGIIEPRESFAENSDEEINVVQASEVGAFRLQPRSKALDNADATIGDRYR